MIIGAEHVEATVIVDGRRVGTEDAGTNGVDTAAAFIVGPNVWALDSKPAAMATTVRMVFLFMGFGL